MSKKYRITKKDLVTIQDFVDTIPYKEYIEVFTSSKFESDIDEKSIFLGSKRYSRLDKIFFDWLATQQKQIDYNFFVIALLHEVGHILTANRKKLELREKLVEINSFMYNTDLITEQEYSYNYFGFPAEIEATKWAIKYYNRNREKCEKLAAMLGV